MCTKLINVICSVMANFIVTVAAVVSLVKYRIVPISFSSAQFPVSYGKLHTANLVAHFYCDQKAM